MTEREFMQMLRADTACLLDRAELVTKLLPVDIRDLAMGERLYTLKSMLWQYDQAIAKASRNG